MRQNEYFIQVLMEFVENKDFASMSEYTQHARVSCLEHSVFVAYVSFLIWNVFRMKEGKRSLIRGALLHDFFLYDWHDKSLGHKWHGFYHPSAALANAKGQFPINLVEADIIKKHMFPLVIYPPKYRQSAIVCIADKICAICEISRIYPNLFCMPEDITKKLDL
ncbi:HD domain-containing protein [Anaeromicropila populeti]|uniref:HD/PDEase domain-containing protein n=1 Tax=Anaeromicropila populeti TaxID=37658 RepID=A0A1I6JLX0_9FIRM|nr:phosphohydrolase [Anaeromicropila populeti]SFR79939.1 uncharacterized protein SAMN05661086_01738 [Anaeromicropila populeti]